MSLHSVAQLSGAFAHEDDLMAGMLLVLEAVKERHQVLYSFQRVGGDYDGDRSEPLRRRVSNGENGAGLNHGTAPEGPP